MAGFAPEISMQQQFGQMQQMQQMAAMMSAAGMVGGNAPVVNGMCDAGTGVPSIPMPAAPAPIADNSLLTAAAAGVPGMGDPATLQAFAAYASYLQQAQAYAGLSANPASFAPAAPLPNYSMPALPPTPAINVAVDNMKFQYQLTDDDLQKVFSRYGFVREIRVDGVGTTAQVTFDDYNCAQSAMNDLNGKVLNGLEGTLRINWAPAAPAAAAPAAPYSMMPSFPGGWGFAGNNAWPNAPAEVPAFPPSPMAGGSPLSPMEGTPPPNSYSMMNATPDGKAPAHVKGVRKYTCRFLVGIENDKDFQVVRRIIGTKGSNMKRIVKQSEAKLRLRGVGSGYFEGAGQKESSEPLQLCVSCTSPEGYRTAVSLVEELMEGVYTEFRAFCQESGRPEPDLHATPQLVSSGRERGGGGVLSVGDLFSPDGSSPGLGFGDDDEDDDLVLSTKREGGRKRGRRSRGKKSEGGKVEKGEPPRNAPVVEEIQHNIDQRNEARRQCNFAEADRIRQSLHERGVALMDEPGGRGKASEVTTWRYWRE